MHAESAAPSSPGKTVSGGGRGRVGGDGSSSNLGESGGGGGVRAPLSGRGTPTGEDSASAFSHPHKLVDNIKRESVGLEYAGLLSNQLESQREYFDKQIAKLEYQTGTNLSLLEAGTAAARTKRTVQMVETATLRAKLVEIRAKEEVAMALYKSNLAHIQAQKVRTDIMLAEQSAWKQQIAAAQVVCILAPTQAG
jgi:hypothetical protein